MDIVLKGASGEPKEYAILLESADFAGVQWNL